MGQASLKTTFHGKNDVLWVGLHPSFRVFSELPVRRKINPKASHDPALVLPATVWQSRQVPLPCLGINNAISTAWFVCLLSQAHCTHQLNSLGLALHQVEIFKNIFKVPPAFNFQLFFKYCSCLSCKVQDADVLPFKSHECWFLELQSLLWQEQIAWTQTSKRTTNTFSFYILPQWQNACISAPTTLENAHKCLDPPALRDKARGIRFYSHFCCWSLSQTRNEEWILPLVIIYFKTPLSLTP